jgi:hypothetical protein
MLIVIIFSVISILSLIFILILYSLLHELRKLQGRNVMCYFIALIIFFSVFLYLHIVGETSSNLPAKVCSYLLYFSKLHSLFRLNILFYEVYKKASIISFETFEKTSELLGCLLYAVVAPLIFTFIVVLLDHNVPFQKLFPNQFISNLSTVQDCAIATGRNNYRVIFSLIVLELTFSDNSVKCWIFIYSMEIIIMFMNVVLLMLILRTIYNSRKNLFQLGVKAYSNYVRFHGDNRLFLKTDKKIHSMSTRNYFGKIEV